MTCRSAAQLRAECRSPWMRGRAPSLGGLFSFVRSEHVIGGHADARSRGDKRSSRPPFRALRVNGRLRSTALVVPAKQEGDSGSESSLLVGPSDLLMCVFAGLCSRFAGTALGSGGLPPAPLPWSGLSLHVRSVVARA